MSENWKILFFILLTILMVAGIGYFITQDSYRNSSAFDSALEQKKSLDDNDPLKEKDSPDNKSFQKEEAEKLKAQQEVKNELEGVDSTEEKIDAIVDSLISETVTLEDTDLLEDLEQEEDQRLEKSHQEATELDLR